MRNQLPNMKHRDILSAVYRHCDRDILESTKPDTHTGIETYRTQSIYILIKL